MVSYVLYLSRLLFSFHFPIYDHPLEHHEQQHLQSSPSPHHQFVRLPPLQEHHSPTSNGTTSCLALGDIPSTIREEEEEDERYRPLHNDDSREEDDDDTEEGDDVKIFYG